MTAESGRASTENARVSAESARTSAETARSGRDTAFRVWENYDNGKAYVPLNKVQYNGSSYECVANTTGNAPPNATYWQLIAARGVDGEGAGDMLASVYAQSEGVVKDSAKLNGQAASYYATASDLSEKQDALGFTPISSTAKGAAGGVAELDAGGRVPSSQLPSYVDDVLEYAAQGNFPATGETDKIYIAQDTNKTYRWSGSAYVEISASLALGETSATAYRGDLGAATAANVTTLKNAETVLATSGTSPNYTVSDATVTAYTYGLRRTIFFHQAGTNVTLNFNGLGAKPVYKSNCVLLKVEGWELVEVWYEGSSFFAVNSGGGIDLPSAPSAGETAIYAIVGDIYKSTLDSFANVGSGYGFSVVAAGTYRLKYRFRNPNEGYLQLPKMVLLFPVA